MKTVSARVDTALQRVETPFPKAYNLMGVD